jgi:hypothetical protein
MKLIDYLAIAPNEATKELLATPGYTYAGFIRALKGTLGPDMQLIDERWLRDLTDPALQRAYRFYAERLAEPQQRLAA